MQQLYVMRIIMNFFKKIIQLLKPVSQEDLNEAYLNQATSLEDLEWRMKQLDRENMSRGKNFPMPRQY